jgi:uncharacterized protein (DUF983 family)
VTQPSQLSTFGLIWAGLLGRCPKCRRGKLFEGFLTISGRCHACGLSFIGHDAGDGPAVAVIFILGAAAVALALWIEFTFFPPLWVHLVLWPLLVIGGAIGLLRPLKGLTVALQYKVRSVEEPPETGGS